MRAALLALAAAEVRTFGYITQATRGRLMDTGVQAHQIESYLSTVGVN
jgi:hypothetical protein